MWSITSPPRRQSTPRFPNSGITSTGMPKQWSSSAMTTRQSLPFREILPSAVNNGRPGLSRPAMPSTTRELMIVRSLPVHVLQLAHALQALYPLSHIDRARPRQPPTAAEPRRQQLGDSGQNRPTCLSILTCRGLLPPLQPLLSPPPELFLEADQLTGHVESILVDCSLKIPPHSTAATMRMLTDRPGTTYLGPSAKSTVESSENISSKDEDPTSPSNVEIPPMDAAAQIEEELDLDLDDLKIDESIDPADVNIDDLLSDD
ncbi:hypothetical protein GQR58_013198 [Nymphon striatum]|nr:hypothetical protein GQR58_013198 [Nymphon striatum]